MSRKTNSRKVTGPKVASDAGELLNDPRTSKKVKSVAGSALSQTPNRRKRKKGKNEG